MGELEYFKDSVNWRELEISRLRKDIIFFAELKARVVLQSGVDPNVVYDLCNDNIYKCLALIKKLREENVKIKVRYGLERQIPKSTRHIQIGIDKHQEQEGGSGNPDTKSPRSEQDDLGLAEAKDGDDREQNQPR